jgi:hypothetical protein
VAAFKRWNQKDQDEALKIEANANKARIPEQIQEVKKKKKVNINKNLNDRKYPKVIRKTGSAKSFFLNPCVKV